MHSKFTQGALKQAVLENLGKPNARQVLKEMKIEKPQFK